MNMVRRVLSTFVVFVLGYSAVRADTPPASDDPVIARYQGGEIRLRDTEEFARELQLHQRVPYMASAGEWRQFVTRELAKNIIFTTPALQMGRHMDPAYLRGREYYIQEYLDYSMMRDNIMNKIDVSREAQEREFTAHPNDYKVTPTVTLRFMRTKSKVAATSAAARLAAGEDFVAVEREVTEVSPRYIGRALGPFPSPKARMMIPPPKAVLDAAMDTPIGQTTGPLQVGPNYFIARTEDKTTGGLSSLSEVAQLVEERIREREGEQLTKILMDTLRRELDVKEDEQLLRRTQSTRPDDVIATVGATLVRRQEFNDLNGRVRGPALSVAQHYGSRLSQFITPLILAEGARQRGYADREETKLAMYYWDLQHLSTWFIDEQVNTRVKRPTETELRERFTRNFEDLKRENRGTIPTFEAYRQMIEETMLLERRPIAEQQLVSEILQKFGYQYDFHQPCTRLTALEALVHAAPQLPPGAHILEIGEAHANETQGPHWFTGVGRNTDWRITYTTGNGATSELISHGAAPLSDGSAEFTSSPAYLPYASLWKFDTDSLFRHAVDHGMADFAAKYGNRLRLTARVDFAYAEDAPTSLTDCLVVYSAVPADGSNDGFVLKYSGATGEITQRRIGEPEVKCPTCPAPDLPSSIILQQAQSGTTSTQEKQTTASVQAGK
jgi:hypothetical protein